jgi:hypothetical protein
MKNQTTEKYTVLVNYAGNDTEQKVFSSRKAALEFAYEEILWENTLEVTVQTNGQTIFNQAQ